MMVAIYVHIPFCEKKCPYCDFNSYSGYGALHDAYVDALCYEMAAVATRGHEIGAHYVARTLFFGGGTPTLLEPRHFAKLLASAHQQFGWHEGLETTTEANPGTINRTYMQDLRSLGINRVSLGVQSLDDVMLRRLGRIHNARQAVEAIDSCRNAGIENMNMDLMYGLPDQSESHWKKTITQALYLSPEHFSLYPLTIEQDTPFWKLQETGKLVVPGEDEVAEMHEFAAEALGAAGYEHYELSNWAIEPERSSGAMASYRCKHNLTYWHNEPYIGLGAGAHSFIHGERYHNTMSPPDYVRGIETTEDIVSFRERIDQSLEMAETLMLGLRLSEGIYRDTFHTRFCCELDEVVGDVLSQAIQQGLVSDNGEAVALTRRGRLLANEVFVPILDKLTQKA